MIREDFRVSTHNKDRAVKLYPGVDVVKGKVIVVDDDHEVREMIKDFLSIEGFQVEDFDSGIAAYDALRSETVFGSDLAAVDVIISDISMPKMDGLEFLERVKRLCPEVPVVLITAFSSIESAIEATKKGAFDYIVKPFKLDEFGVVVERAKNFRRLKKENESLKQQIKSKWNFSQIIGKSKPMIEVFDLIERVANASANVLVAGSSGTGKELVARAIHEKSHRQGQPFVAINCTSIPENLIESELFGHVKGSFTGALGDKMGLFEEANGGTLFLDEIGDLDLSLQAKLLRAIQERKIRRVGENKDREINVRLIAATHKDLKLAIKEGVFREDLYFRLSVIPITVPSLRQRREDIPLLIEHFIGKYAVVNNSPVRALSPAAVAKLVSAKWEGNVRELENFIERIVVLNGKEIVDVAELPPIEEDSPESFYEKSTTDWPTLAQLEKRYIEAVLGKTGNRKEKASQILGINRRTLYRKEHEYGWATKPEGEEDI